MTGTLRVFPGRTALTPDDPLAFVGYPPLPGFRPRMLDVTRIDVSCCFTWDTILSMKLATAWRELYPLARVSIGGPAWSNTATNEPVPSFVPGLYVKRGVTFTSRGCNNACSFCLVPKYEGRLRLLDPIAPGYIIQDNNFLSTPANHRRKVYEMLSQQPRAAEFRGGLDTFLVDEEVAAEFRDIRIGVVFFAADNPASLARLERAVKRLQFLCPGSNKMRCYVLIGYKGERIEDAEKRLECVWEIGAMPFAMLYQPPERWIEYPKEWRDLAREWIRPAAMRASHTGAAMKAAHRC